MLKKFKAFTFAEILITLGIIGIVAALTIPSLIENYQKKSVANRLKKIYAVTKQAVLLSIAENEEVSGWDWDLAEKDIYSFTKRYFAPYFKGAQLYKGTEFRKIAKNYSIKNLANKRIVIPDSNAYAIIILIDGSYFITKEKHDTGYEWLYLDINGITGPNRIARDVFVLSMAPEYYFNKKLNSEIIFWNEGLSRKNLTEQGPTEDIANSGYYGCSKKNKYGYYSGYNCGALIKLDEWKILSDYPW